MYTALEIDAGNCISEFCGAADEAGEEMVMYPL